MIRSLLPMLCLFILVNSCRKEDKLSARGTELQDGTSTLLHYLYELRTNAAGVSDTVAISHFEYDAQERVIRATDSLVRNDTMGTALVITDYRYTGTDQWPSFLLKSSVYQPGDSPVIDSIWIRYASENVLYDSIRTTDEESGSNYFYVMRYSYPTPSQVIVNRSTTFEGNHSEGNYSADLSMVNGNFTSFHCTDTILGNSILIPVWECTYNTHPDPLYKASIPWTFRYANGSPLPARNAQPNLPQQQRIKYFGWGDIYTIDYAYTYRADGYPVSGSTTSNGWFPTTFLYSYY